LEVNVNRLVSVMSWSIVLALVWAAGHDILSGEEDVRLEYGVVVVSFLAALTTLIIKICKIKFGGRV